MSAAEKMEQLIKLFENLCSVSIEDADDLSVDEMEQYYCEFRQIYSEGFRHWYSRISSFLDIQTPDAHTTLKTGLGLISDYVRENHSDDNETCLGIDKLLDHIELESIRIDRMKAVGCMAEEAKGLYEKTHESEETAKNQANEAKEQVKNIHEQSIAILGSFSAVVLAFVGGLSFSSSALANIGSVSMFRLIVTLLILGFVLFNSLFILAQFIFCIVYHRPQKAPFQSTIRFYNVVLLVTLIVTVVLYAIGFGRIIELWGA